MHGGMSVDTGETYSPISLAVQTVTGAAKLVSESGEKPEKLRQNVTSKGGTTQAALAHLEANHWK